MSKKPSGRISKRRMNTTTDNSGIQSWTSSRGITIKLAPLSPLLIEKMKLGVDRDIGVPKKPTYETIVGTGENITTQEIEHDEKSIEETPQDKPKWDAYVAHVKKHEAELNARFLRAVKMMVVRFDMPEDDGWIEIQKMIGVDVPDDPDERRIHYLDTEILGDPQDLFEIATRATMAGGLDKESRAAAIALFRGAIQKEIGSRLKSAR